MKKKIILLTCLLLTACTPKETKLYKKMTLDAGFDTTIAVNLYADSEKEFNEVAQEAFNNFLYLNNLFDKYNHYDNLNNIKTINDNAGKQPVKVDPILIDMLLLAKDFNEYSNGQFDITLGPVLNIWHDIREKAEKGEPITLPTDQQLQEAKVCSGWDKVEINENENTVYLNQPCASLDVGAIAKGYATQYVAKTLTDKGYTHGFLDAGHNIQILGSKNDGSPWRSGILAPTQNNMGHSLVFLDISEPTAFVTSGDYQRYFMVNDEIMHHIIDPDTLYPARHAKSITVLTPDSGIADILSTTLYTMTYQEGMEMIQTIQAQGIKAEALWIYDQVDEIKEENYYEKEGFYIIATDDFQERIKE